LNCAYICKHKREAPSKFVINIEKIKYNEPK
jgi:hypothetical protein